MTYVACCVASGNECNNVSSHWNCIELGAQVITVLMFDGRNAMTIGECRMVSDDSRLLWLISNYIFGLPFLLAKGLPFLSASTVFRLSSN